MAFLRMLAAAGGGYLAGTVPSADLVARAASGGSTDIRVAGSGNPGAANTAEVLGTGWGAVVLGADAAKGAAACALGRRVAGPAGGHVAGVAAVIGHCFPVWTGFRGGKGVATSFGQLLGSFPEAAPAAVATIAAVHRAPVGFSGNRALVATAAAAAVWVAAGTRHARRAGPGRWGTAPSRSLPVAAALSSAIVLTRFAQEERRAILKW